MANDADKRLIKQLKSYDPKLDDEAMRTLLQKYERKIINYLLSKSAKEEDAKEVIHDGLMALIDNARKGLLDKLEGSLEGYLNTICRNMMNKRFNKKPPFQSLDEDEARKMTDHHNTLKDIIGEEEKQWLRGLIQKLGSKCDEILYRFYYRGQKMKAIAEAMGYTNEQVARNKKSKCMKKLRDMIDNKDR